MNETGHIRVGTVLFLVFAVMLIGVLVLYTLKSRPPILPADRDHAFAREPAACLACHGPSRQHARGPNHPLNDKCNECHERP